MAPTSTLVTANRYQEGLLYRDYVEHVRINKDKFQKYYDALQIYPQDIERLRRTSQRPNGPMKILALVEAWCPDVILGLPTIARIAEQTEMELRVFQRERNLDIMDKFLNHGQFRSIPTVVFFTRDQQYICHWIERPLIATAELEAIAARIKAEQPDISQSQFLAERSLRTLGRWRAWQQATVDEIIVLLEENPRP